MHRIGQKSHTVSTYCLLAESTIEARVMGLQALRVVVHEPINKEATGQTVGRNSKGGKSEASPVGSLAPLYLLLLLRGLSGWGPARGGVRHP